ncbi:hypothetical protein [Verrucomicrobium sp. BvORR034]|uniref:hypothetical protein n=1 Tax=Verrucomicrobium sp. BvORR034 TaxID=1396418 RepID=UPI0006786D8B|nr:hypothetical protein [Verrucomicrobium sp. BvORR034]
MVLLSCVVTGVALAEPGPSGLPPMLDLAGIGTDPAKIDYNLLPEEIDRPERGEIMVLAP